MNQISHLRRPPGEFPTKPSVSAPPDGPAPLRPSDLLKLLRRRHRSLIRIPLILMFGTGLLVTGATPRYVAYSQMLLGEQGLSARNSFDLVEQQSLTSSVIEGELAVLRSNALLRRVAETLQLETVPEFNPEAIPEDEQGSVLSDIAERVKSLLPSFGGGGEADLPDDAPSRVAVAAGAGAQQLGTYKDIVGKLRQAIRVNQQGTSYVVQVSAVSEDPDLAAAITNTLMDEYMGFLTDKRFNAAQEFTAWLETRVADLAVTLERSERDVFDYRARMEADADNRTRLEQQMTELTTRLIDRRAELAQVEAMYDKMGSTIETGGPLAAQDMSSSEAMLDYRQQLSELIQREAFAVGSFGEQSAQVASIRRSIDVIEASIELEVRRELDRLQNQREVLRVVVSSLNSQLNELSRQMLDQSSEEIQLNQLQRVAEANSVVYQEFLARFKEVSEIQNLQTPDADIISYANPPSAPVYPRKKLSVIMAGVGGFFIAFAYVLLTEMLPKKLSTPEALARATGIGVYGRMRDLGAQMTLHELARELNRDPEGKLSQIALRLANNADMRAGGAARTILVASDTARDDKVHVAMLLAWAQSRKGRSCVVVDADTRTANLSGLLEYRRPAGNLASTLYGDTEIGQAITGLPRFGASFVPCEEMASDPSVVFDTERFRQILQTLSRQFDTVILDLPPAQDFTDAFTSLEEMDIELFVVRAGTLTGGELHEPLEVARNANARNLGLVLTNDATA
ncbi:GumC family protein [Celeribacter indicus]|uniref:Succinoglycan biosynthesis transport protein exoP n=1 Tax=Celeribacter indicus TaxID=1208324 RepID=A0A0B5DXS1_9RHOB|nr:exopolysaccharide transport family protein [Celeribacter indicus]AJE47799.1 succinoglycan biosynthesis transport protein exoP [Celeribacter indicus]SDW23276.1 Uncharacterized protein involved in exopolysaccharide biosynthesis [Celeribacter indicus]